MKLGLAARLALLFALLVAVTAFVSSGASAFSTNRQISGDVDRFLRNRVEEITSGERLDPRNRRRSDRNQGQGQQGEEQDETDGADGEGVNLSPAVDADAEVQTLDERGTVEATVGVVLPVNDVERALAADRGPDYLRTVTVDGTDYRMITSHLDDGGAVQVAVDLEDSKGLAGSVRGRSLIIGLLMSALAGLAGWWLARRTTRPLRQLAASAETVAATRDLSATIDLDRDDEIGRLADSFDDMLRALARSRDQQHRLVQDAAHELRTPLTSINANIDLLTHAPDLDPEVRTETLQSTRSELRQLNALFTEIIELATDDRDAPAWQHVDLAVVANASIERFQARSSIPVNVDAEPSMVNGDPAAIERAITNLLSNADKYGSETGPITVSVHDATVRVINQGEGVAEADLDHVFDRFYRSDAARAQPGAGLGLAIVDKIVTDHGGRAWLRNREQGGVEAGFQLPVEGAGLPIES